MIVPEQRTGERSATDVFDPLSGELIDTVVDASGEVVDGLLDRASRARRSRWPRDSRWRADCLEGAAERIAARRAAFSQMLVQATGKTGREADLEIDRTIEEFRCAAHAIGVWRDEYRAHPDGSGSQIRHLPVGVAVLITPWNWPLLLVARDLAPALAAGAVVLLKPAPVGTSVAWELVAALHEAGVPGDVLGLAPGGVAVARRLISHPDVQMVAFTGSCAAGREVYGLAAEGCKRLLLELGGLGTAVVLADGDVAAAAEAIVASAIATAGQMCLACRRVVAERTCVDAVRETLLRRLGELRPGAPLEQGSDLGPLISAERLEALLGWLDRAVEAGARVVHGGRRVDVEGFPRAAFMQPTLVEGVPPDSPAAAEEVFGPILQLDVFEEEAALMADLRARPPGLCAAVWSRDLRRAQRLAEEIPAGTVWINRYGAHSADLPSGGVGASGLGRSRGREGIAAFTELKHIYVEGSVG
jgi:betaine-aldehyde dehydrogenase